MGRRAPSRSSIRWGPESAGGGWATSSRPRGGREPPHDLCRRLDARDPADAFPCLPVVSRREPGEVAALEPPRRIERVQGAHEVLGAPLPEQPTGGPPRVPTDPLP